MLKARVGYPSKGNRIREPPTHPNAQVGLNQHSLINLTQLIPNSNHHTATFVDLMLVMAQNLTTLAW